VAGIVWPGPVLRRRAGRPAPLGAPVSAIAARMRETVAPRSCVLTWWSPGPGEFSARVVLDDGTVRDFYSPFELARFLGTPTPNRRAPAHGLR
jgi:hypothetical protein